MTTFWWDKQRYIQQRFTCFWGCSIVFVNPLWRIIIEGREKMRDEPRIYICNHQSMLDILTLYYTHGFFRWIAKQELMKFPILGWVMYLNQDIPISRGDKKSTIKLMEKTQKHIQNGVSIMIFPEGTRSKDGSIKRFKEGAFKMALQNKVPIHPIILDGAQTALPKGSLLLRKKQRIILRVFDEIPYEQFKDKSVATLTKEMYYFYKKQLNELRMER